MTFYFAAEKYESLENSYLKNMLGNFQISKLVLLRCQFIKYKNILNEPLLIKKNIFHTKCM